MAFEMTSNARKSPTSGVCPPVEGFDTAGRRQFERPADRADWHGCQRRNPLKGISLPAGLLLATAQIRADHFNPVCESTS